MPWISKRELDFLKDGIRLNEGRIRDLEERLDNHKSAIEDLQFSSKARTYSMGEVDLAKLAIKVEEINRMIESGQLAKAAADRLVKDILTAYYKGMQ